MFYPNFSDLLFLIRAHSNPKFREGLGLGALASRVGPENYSTALDEKLL